MSYQSISLNNLNKELTGVEDFYQQLIQSPKASSYALDFGRVTYVQPHYLMALNIGVRYLCLTNNGTTR